MAETRTNRCTWVGSDSPLMLEYHDREWGVPVHDDRKHFEFLVLEAAQAGLSWSIVLKKREGYRRAFSQFDPRIPATSHESDAFSKDLKGRGFSFVGSTVMYAHMQAVGMVNDHLLGCFRYRETQRLE